MTVPKPRPPRPHSSRLSIDSDAAPAHGDEAAERDHDEEEQDDAELDAVDAAAVGERAHLRSPRARAITRYAA